MVSKMDHFRNEMQRLGINTETGSTSEDDSDGSGRQGRPRFTNQSGAKSRDDVLRGFDEKLGYTGVSASSEDEGRFPMKVGNVREVEDDGFDELKERAILAKGYVPSAAVRQRQSLLEDSDREWKYGEQHSDHSEYTDSEHAGHEFRRQRHEKKGRPLNGDDDSFEDIGSTSESETPEYTTKFVEQLDEVGKFVQEAYRDRCKQYVEKANWGDHNLINDVYNQLRGYFGPKLAVVDKIKSLTENEDAFLNDELKKCDKMEEMLKGATGDYDFFKDKAMDAKLADWANLDADVADSIFGNQLGDNKRKTKNYRRRTDQELEDFVNEMKERSQAQVFDDEKDNVLKDAVERLQRDMEAKMNMRVDESASSYSNPKRRDSNLNDLRKSYHSAMRNTFQPEIPKNVEKNIKKPWR